mmetsp:Transcript_24764/g.54947  ORF Transcript_24764/g.54947 Transcript_24764/m.54947 type:complete len:515 (+) Transcript_24764:79-1623(+)
MLIPGILLALAAVSVAVGLAIAYIYAIFDKRHKKLPPYSPETMWQNIKASTVGGGLYQVQRMRRFLLGVDPKSLGASEQGSTILLAIPTPNYFIITSDTVLARGVLCGDNGISEGDHSALGKIVNFVDPSQSNILTHKTANADRESARKAIAPAFSTSNLTRTWPHVKLVLGEQFAKFRQTAASGDTVDCKSMVVRFFLRTLSRGAYNIEFTDDGTENEGNINGLAYLHEIDVCSREMSNQIFIPLRRHMWWDSKVRRGALANKRLGEMMGKIVRLHREKGEGGKHTILDHVVGHSYKSETQRLCDLAVITSASIDTTAHTMCFLLMELARRPEVKAKLLAALETVMPDRFEAEGAADDASGRELMSKIASLEYLSWCIKETLRLWPVAAVVARDLTQDVEHNGMLLPKGSLVFVHFYSMFRSPWIDNVDEFVPERWGPQNPQLARLKETVHPFSLGRRTCLGQNMAMFQMRAVAAHFVHYFDFELQGEPTVEIFITLKVDDMQMKVTPRKGHW